MTNSPSFRRPLLALALCAMAGAVMAQSPSSPGGAAGTGTTPPSATGTPMTTPTTPMTSSGINATSRHLPSRTDSADNAYKALDPSNRGYLSKNEVQGISGFSFEAADTNHDGKLTRDEFNRAWGSKAQ
jgi:hypothetical protein